ncbi:Uncharacterized protein GBIM_12860 [Gryllus bimaculatus]|nr:Uncharacterized protein GBIM_12860 [Gryllus bimaculatus]
MLQSNLTHLMRKEFVPGVGLGIAKCPYDPADNSTAVWVERGNPGELPGLYSGTNAEFTKADAVIFRTDLHNLTTGRSEYTFKRTLKYDSKWLDNPTCATASLRRQCERDASGTMGLRAVRTGAAAAPRCQQRHRDKAQR